MKKHLILILVLLLAAFGLQACKDTSQEAREEQAETQEEMAQEQAEETPAEEPGTAEQPGETADTGLGEDVETGMEEVGSEITDAGITTAVKAKFAADDVVKAYEIDVDTENGIVTLNGTVKSPEESNRAVEIAQAVDGVKQVKNRLTVSPL